VHHWNAEQVTRWFEMVFEKGGVKSEGEVGEDIDEIQSNLRVRTGFELQQLLQLDSDMLETRFVRAGLQQSSRELLRQAMQLLKAQKKEERRQRDIQKLQSKFGGQYSQVGFSLAALVGGLNGFTSTRSLVLLFLSFFLSSSTASPKQ